MGYSAFITQLNSELGLQYPSSLSLLQQAALRQLRELSSFRTLMMEDTASFSTVAGQERYTAGVAGFPPDLMVADYLWYELGGERIEVPGPLPMSQLRFGHATTQTTYPVAWGWQGQALYLAPPTSGSITVFLDYFRDATRDSLTGVEIAAHSTVETNPWIDGRGELVLRNAVLADYYSQPLVRDPEAASACLAMRNQFLDTLLDEWRQRKSRPAQAPLYMGDLAPDEPRAVVGV